MTMVRGAAVSLGLGLLLSPAMAAEKKTRAVNPPAAKNSPQPRVQPPPTKGLEQPDKHPGQQVVNKLLQMTPGEREKALAALPPARRQNIERRLGEIENMPPAQQNRVRNRQELLLSLPPQRQNQVRRSLNQFRDLPEERKGLLNQEMRQIARMPDEERRERMNSEEFRNRYSASEQQMMGNILEVMPQQ